MIKMVGDMAKSAAAKVYEQAGIGPDDVDVVELHDYFTTNELLTYEALGLSKEGEPRSSPGTATTPTAASSSPTRPAASCPRATLSARPASRSAPSSSGTCAARPRPARSRTPRSRSSTTSASAAPPS
jgi:thiolase-like protein